MAERWSPSALDRLLAETNAAVDRGVRARHAASSDWGRVIHEPPLAVVRPTSVPQVAAVVRFANEHGLALTPRATGASQGGQSVAAGSVVLDLGALSAVEEADTATRTISCGPGATWRAVLSRTIPLGLIPFVVPMHLDLSVGGTLSVGGIGSTSHRFGAAASSVARLDVVDGTGRTLRCDATEQPELFDAVRAGLGRCGVIVDATIALRPVAATTRVARLAYGSIANLVTDLERSCAAPHLTHVQALCHPGEPPSYLMELASDDNAGTIGDLEKIVADLQHEGVLELVEMPSATFAARFDPRFDAMVDGGGAARAHPWVDAFIPFATVERVIPEVLATTIGDRNDRVQLVPVRSDVLPPMLEAPRPGLVAAVVVVPVGIAMDALDEAITAMTAVHHLLLDAGGKRYTSGWFPSPGDASWRAHFGENHDRWARAKNDFDPNETLVSALFPGQRGTP